MTIYEITNPSDAYTIEADVELVAAGAVLLLGSGNYGLESVAGDTVMPPFLFGGHEAWLEERGVHDIGAYLTEHRAEIAACLDTVLPGRAHERCALAAALAHVSDRKEREAAREAFHEKTRSSMNDIGGRAWELAKRLRAQIGAEAAIAAGDAR